MNLYSWLAACIKCDFNITQEETKVRGYIKLIHISFEPMGELTLQDFPIGSTHRINFATGEGTFVVTNKNERFVFVSRMED